MVKGISRQVIVVNAPEPKIFDQAIFILKDNASNLEGITDDMLIREAKRLVAKPRKNKALLYGPVWGLSGALLIGILWLLTAAL